MPLAPLTTLDASRFERPDILKKLIGVHRHLAELKGAAAGIPNQDILINTLGLQEAKASSAIENIVTTHDDLFQGVAFPESAADAAVKEVARYAQALRVGFAKVREHGLLTGNHILAVQGALEQSRPGYRMVPGTTLRDDVGRVVYTPPSPELLPALMGELEGFINDPGHFHADQLVKMALLHHQFESIHPFYDGNGRTGRIVNVLYLVREGLLESPVLYMSRAIMRTKADYYRLLQDVRERDLWEDWVLYLLDVVDQTAQEGTSTIAAIKVALMDYKHRIRERHRKIYSQDLINNLFSHPYTKIDFVVKDLDVTRLTATRYLDLLAKDGFLLKRRIGRANYYINPALYRILTGEAPPPEA